MFSSTYANVFGTASACGLWIVPELCPFSEAKLLRNPKVQTYLADQFAEGVAKFLAHTPEVARDDAAQADFDRVLARQNNGRSTAE